MNHFMSSIFLLIFIVTSRWNFEDKKDIASFTKRILNDYSNPNTDSNQYINVDDVIKRFEAGEVLNTNVPRNYKPYNSSSSGGGCYFRKLSCSHNNGYKAPEPLPRSCRLVKAVPSPRNLLSEQAPPVPPRNVEIPRPVPTPLTSLSQQAPPVPPRNVEIPQPVPTPRTSLSQQPPPVPPRNVEIPQPVPTPRTSLPEQAPQVPPRNTLLKEGLIPSISSTGMDLETQSTDTSKEEKKEEEKESKKENLYLPSAPPDIESELESTNEGSSSDTSSVYQLGNPLEVNRVGTVVPDDLNDNITQKSQVYQPVEPYTQQPSQDYSPINQSSEEFPLLSDNISDTEFRARLVPEMKKLMQRGDDLPLESPGAIEAHNVIPANVTSNGIDFWENQNEINKPNVNVSVRGSLPKDLLRLSGSITGNVARRIKDYGKKLFM